MPVVRIRLILLGLTLATSLVAVAVTASLPCVSPSSMHGSRRSAASSPAALVLVADGQLTGWLRAGLPRSRPVCRCDLATVSRGQHHRRPSSRSSRSSSSARGDSGLDDTVEGRLPGLVPGGRRIDDPRSPRPPLRAAPTTRRRRGSSPGRCGATGAGRRGLVRLALALAPSARSAGSRTRSLTMSSSASSSSGPRAGRLQAPQRIIVPLRLTGTSFAPVQLPAARPHGYTPSQHDGVVGSLATARDRAEDHASPAERPPRSPPPRPTSPACSRPSPGPAPPPRLLALMLLATGAREGSASRRSGLRRAAAGHTATCSGSCRPCGAPLTADTAWSP